MGVVYAARHEVLGQRVALKVLRPDYAAQDEVHARFLQEARTATRIESEHVARTLDVGKLASGLPYIVIELLEGKDLADVLTEKGPLPIADAVDHVLQALEAVAEAHAMGIVHRDLKPSNLFLARRKDGSVTVKVLDFGITKTCFDDGAVQLTSTSQILGTPAYMSPEQLRQSREVDARADIWAVGVVLYELLSGELPFVGGGVGALFAAILEDTPMPLSERRPDVPRELESAVMKCLVRSRASRWQSVADLARAIRPFGSHASGVSSDRILRVLPVDVPVDEELAPITSPMAPPDAPGVRSSAPSIPDVAPPGAQVTGPSSPAIATDKRSSRNAVDPTLRLEAPTTGPRLSLEGVPTVAPIVTTGASWADASQATRSPRKIPLLAFVAFILVGSVGLALVVASVSSQKSRAEGLPPGAATAPPIVATALPTVASPLTSAVVQPTVTASVASADVPAPPASHATPTVATAPSAKHPLPSAHPSASVTVPAPPASAMSSSRPNPGILDRN
jgi:serine/threonine-protein kinase